MPSSHTSRINKKKPARLGWANRPPVTTQGEAVESIMDGLTYFVKKHPYRTLTTIGLLLLGTVYATKYFVFEKQDVEFEARKPLTEMVDPSERTPDGLFMASAVALEPQSKVKLPGDTLWVRSKPWAILDPNYVIGKEYGKPVIVVRDMRDSLADPLFLKVPALDEENLKQQQYKK